MQPIKTNINTAFYRFLFIVGGLLFVPFLVDAQTFYPKNFRFDSYTINEGLSESMIPVIAEDKYGEILIATERGMDIFNGYDFDHISHITSRQSINAKTEKLGMIENISPWQNGYLFIQKYDTASFLFDPSDRSFIAADSLIHFSSNERGLKFHRLYCVLTMEEGVTWIGTNNGVLIIDQHSVPGIPSFKRLLTGQSIQVTALQKRSTKPDLGTHCPKPYFDH